MYISRDKFLGLSLQIVSLHMMLSKAVVKTRPTVLWCYKDKLELSRCNIFSILFDIVLSE